MSPQRHSMSYHTCWTLHAALKKALHDDEYEELKESVGSFHQVPRTGVDWASRLVHYMLGFQLDIKKKYELWSLYIEDLERPHSVVTKELTSFGRCWEFMSSWAIYSEIIAALERCEGWSRMIAAARRPCHLHRIH
ncbi:hypothetical protein Bca52824_074512 [Brassica carinata]|uniref:Uncharacterized protein n=1 Tax=Brassica carinata TaxID=52824 RepID=A0A8X7PQN7_BRACI|nr:hypothetical protein Bca52824_074512 [Brassica carinata]